MRPALSALLLCACFPPTTPAARVDDQASYTAACEAALGRLPALRCADADPLPTPVTVGGHTRQAATKADLESGFRCDHPSGLSRCVPGSRALVGQTDRGVPFVFVCRQYEEHPDDPDRYDQIGLIASDPRTGTTCFWSTPDDGLRRGDPVPHPGSAPDVGWAERSFWYTWEELRSAPCTDCHDNDAWVHTPWIHDAGIPSVPLAPYEILGLQELGWEVPPRLVHPGAEACTTCHHLAAGRSCQLALDAAGRKNWQMPVSSTYEVWPASRWMPSFEAGELLAGYANEAAWDAQWGEAVEVIAACCADPDDEQCWAAP